MTSFLLGSVLRVTTYGVTSYHRPIRDFTVYLKTKWKNQKLTSLSYNAASLPGSLFVNNAINGAVETLAYVVLTAAMPFVGRKKLTSVSLRFRPISFVVLGGFVAQLIIKRTHH